MPVTPVVGGLDVALRGAAVVALALALDVTVGELPERIHPVALLGRVIALADREWANPETVGVSVALFVPFGAATLAGSVVLLSGVTTAGGVAMAGLLLFSTISLRRLISRAREVIEASETDPDRARERLPALAGRDPSPLPPGHLRSAAVESLAENLADGFVAPLTAFVLGAAVSLPVAVGAAVWVKAVNTLDSMLGYRTKPVGRASARLDDLVMWLPARLTALVLALAGRDPEALRRACVRADAPPSPNAGWPMASLAAVLSVRLEKPGVYTLDSAPDLPDVADGECAMRVTAIAGAIAGFLAIVGAGVASC